MKKVMCRNNKNVKNRETDERYIVEYSLIDFEYLILG